MSLNGVVDIAYKLLDYDRRYDNIAKNLLGKIVVVDTYDNAVLIAKKTQSRYKLVTLTGEFFNTGGSITGGTQHFSKVGLLGRQKQLERLDKEITDHKEKLSSTNSQIFTLIKQIDKISSEIDDLEKTISEKTMIAARLESSISSLDDTYSNNLDALNNIKMKKSDLSDRIKGFDEKISILNQKLEALVQQIDLDKLTISDYEAAQKEDTVKRDNIYLDISDLKVSVNSIEESLKSNDESLIRIGFEKQALVVKRNDIIKRNAQLDVIKNDLKAQIEQKSKTIANPQKTQDGLNQKIKEVADKRKRLIAENEDYIQSITDANKDIMMLQNKISSLEVVKAKTDAEMSSMKERMWDEYNMTHNEALQKHSEIENITEARKQISYAKGVIKQLGPVNLESIEDYARTNERYRFFLTQKEDIEKSKEDLYKTINELNTVMKKLFKEKFV